MPRKQVYVRLRSKTTGEWFVHPDLRPRLLEDAAAAETTITDVVNRILSARFQVQYEPTARRSKPSDQDEGQLTLRLTEPIERAVKAVAANSLLDWQDVLRRALCEAYGLPTSVAVAA